MTNGKSKSPQLEDGFIRMPNTIMEALAMIRISGEARQVLDVIFRKTYGWSKTKDRISLSQFTKLTGMGKVAVCKAINKLLAMNIITKEGNDSGVTYGIQKHCSKWKPLPKKVTLPKEVIIVTQKGNNRYPKRDPQNKVVKETITKEIRPNSNEFRLAKLLLDLILIRNPGHKRPNLEEWAEHVRKMICIDNRSANDIEIIILWVQSGKSKASRFWSNNILSTKTLREKFDRLWLDMQGEKPVKDFDQKNQKKISYDEVTSEHLRENPDIFKEINASGYAIVKKSLDEIVAERDIREGVTTRNNPKR